MAKEKVISTKEKAVETKEKTPKTPQKLTYEQLEQLASQYYSQCKSLNNALEECEKKLTEATNQLEIFRTNEFWMRIEWLWRVITLEGCNEIFSNGFLDKVIKEFETRMYPPKPEGKIDTEPKN